jgi:predicted peptidase
MRTVDQDFESRMPVRLPYRVYLPDDYEAAPGAPTHSMIVFLHGGAARGEDVSQVAMTGLPAKLERGDSLPFIVVAPQCPRNLDWSMILPALDAFIVNVTTSLQVDLDRVYLTGLSTGGFGVWALATEYPNHFAAAAPICGGGRKLLDFPERLKRIVHLPVWNFHGDQDEEIPIQESTRLVEALRDYGGNVRSTVYAGVGHDSWTQTYDNPELYDWFRRHVRRTPGANRAS